MTATYQASRTGQLFDSIFALSISVAAVCVLVANVIAPVVGLA